MWPKTAITCDAGSQYRCRWVGRNIQPPALPQPNSPQTHSHIQKTNCSIINERLLRFLLERNGQTEGPTDGPTDGRMDKTSYRVACPRPKNVPTNRWTDMRGVESRSTNLKSRPKFDLQLRPLDRWIYDATYRDAATHLKTKERSLYLLENRIFPL